MASVQKNQETRSGSAFRVAARVGAIALGAVTLLGSAALFVGFTSSVANASVAHPAAATGIRISQHPAGSVSPSPNFLSAGTCAGGADTVACNTIVLHAVTHARQVLEKDGSMSFSLAAYEKLTPDEQLFVTANVERVERGLPAITVLSKSLSTIAQDGANTDDDPPLNRVAHTLKGGGHWVSLGGNWAGGYVNALGADYGWMYNDKGSAWGHRDNILATYVTAASCGGKSYEIAMGAGHVTRGKVYGDSEAELFAGVCGPAPTDAVMTWTQAKKLLHIG